MIRSSEEMAIDIKKQMRGGNGHAEITHIYKGDELKGNSRLCARIKLNVGCSIGTHTHDNEEEIYYILSGEGIVIDDGVPKEVGAGDAVLTRDGASHSIENSGNEVLDFMAVINLY